MVFIIILRRRKDAEEMDFFGCRAGGPDRFRVCRLRRRRVFDLWRALVAERLDRGEGEVTDRTNPGTITRGEETMNKRILRFLAAFSVFLLTGSAAFAAVAEPATAPLSANTQYTITLQKLTSVGTLQTLETTTGTTDADGVLSFTLASVPTKDDANFIFITVTDGSGNVVRKGVSPAPPPNDNNATGLNLLSTKQADALVSAASLVGSDDPIVAAYMFIILRSPELTQTDIGNIAQLAVEALTNPTVGFESYLLSHGVTGQTIADLKKCLIYNPDNNAKTLRDYGRNFFNAVEASDEASATAEMQKAGGFMAEIFLDAGLCSGVGASEILAAHDAAGDGAAVGGAMDSMPAGIRASIETAMTTFNRRIGIVRISSEYTDALSTLGASGTQVTQFLTSVGTLMQANSAIDTQFSGYYMDRDAYLADNPGGYTTDDQVREAMNTAYSAGWAQFQANIAATAQEIADMISQMQAANPGIQLPPGFGQWYDQSGTSQNWPIPQVVLVNWMADTTFAYSPRDNTAIPTMMQNWLGSCSNTSFWDKPGCEGNGGVWTTARHNFEYTGSEIMKAYLALQEDLNILQMKKSELWNTNPDATGAERAANEAEYMEGVQRLAGRISGNKGSVAITGQEKQAIVKLLMSPEI
jgi:hypothetical protein